MKIIFTILSLIWIPHLFGQVVEVEYATTYIIPRSANLPIDAASLNALNSHERTRYLAYSNGIQVIGEQIPTNLF